jgi:pimeloyl-ACP methyl ester carboxylesterase
MGRSALKASANAIRYFQIWPDLETVRAPVALAYAESDTLHGAGEIERMAGLIPGARAIPCPSNKHMHSAALKPQIDAFLQTLEARAVG